jgi:anti-sigma factor RsiW
MSFSCSMVRARLAGYAAETLGAEERRAVREHLVDCLVCFEEAAASDATLLFVRAGSEEVAVEEVARVLSAVRTGIDLKRVQLRLDERTTRRPVGVLASATAAAVLLLALVPSGSLSHRPEQAPRVAGPGPERTAVKTFLPVAVPEGSQNPEPESGSPVEATVYDWNPGGEQPRVVWIVDRSLDI